MQVILTYGDLFCLCQDIIPTSVTPRAGCNVTVNDMFTLWRIYLFQSNAPRAGCNPWPFLSYDYVYSFQSNAPHAGCNKLLVTVKAPFQSNAPHAGCNRTQSYRLRYPIHFNLTHPMRGATAKLYNSSVSW